MFVGFMQVPNACLDLFTGNGGNRIFAKLRIGVQFGSAFKCAGQVDAATILVVRGAVRLGMFTIRYRGDGLNLSNRNKPRNSSRTTANNVKQA
jgi:hypothetical protein